MNGDPLSGLGGLSDAPMTAPPAGGTPFRQLLAGGLKGIGQGVMQPGFRKAYNLGAGGVQDAAAQAQKKQMLSGDPEYDNLVQDLQQIQGGLQTPPLRRPAVTPPASGTTQMGGMPPMAQGGQ